MTVNTASTSPGQPGSTFRGPSTETELRKRKELRNAKFFATGLLILATLIYLGCRYLQVRATGNGEHPAAWIGYVRAASEAGMVGALADWFAVTALFRHPMGVPIPHTAILPKNKDRVGTGLAEFVGENFLNPELIVEKIRSAHVAERVGSWLTTPGSAERVSHEVGKFTANALAAVNKQDAELVIKSAVIDRAAEPEWGPPAGRLLKQLIDEGKTEPIVQELSEWLYRKAQTSGGLLDRVMGERAPSWAPRFAKDFVAERVHRELVDWAWHVKTDPNHEARQTLRGWLDKLADDLQHDPKTMAKVEEIKADLLGSKAAQDAPGVIWDTASSSLIDQARQADSLLRVKLTETARNFGHRMQAEPELRHRIDDRVEGAVRFLATNYGGEVTTLITDTVERWDAQEASSKIELMVGRDLQFIRVNGTVVGALAGLAIYTLSELLFV